MRSQAHQERAPEQMANRCPLCTERVGDLGDKIKHLVSDHKRTSTEAEALIERFNPTAEMRTPQAHATDCCCEYHRPDLFQP